MSPASAFARRLALVVGVDVFEPALTHEALLGLAQERIGALPRERVDDILEAADPSR